MCNSLLALYFHCSAHISFEKQPMFSLCSYLSPLFLSFYCFLISTPCWNFLDTILKSKNGKGTVVIHIWSIFVDDLHFHVIFLKLKNVLNFIIIFCCRVHAYGYNGRHDLGCIYGCANIWMVIELKLTDFIIKFAANFFEHFLPSVIGKVWYCFFIFFCLFYVCANVPSRWERESERCYININILSTYNLLVFWESI